MDRVDLKDTATVTWVKSAGEARARAEGLDDATNAVTAAQARAHIDSEANPHSVTAAQASYDNTASGLTATTVQAAIDELAALLGS